MFFPILSYEDISFGSPKNGGGGTPKTPHLDESLERLTNRVASSSDVSRVGVVKTQGYTLPWCRTPLGSNSDYSGEGSS